MFGVGLLANGMPSGLQLSAGREPRVHACLPAIRQAGRVRPDVSFEGLFFGGG